MFLRIALQISQESFNFLDEILPNIPGFWKVKFEMSPGTHCIIKEVFKFFR